MKFTKRQKIFAGILIIVVAILTDSFTNGLILRLIVPYGHTAAVTWGFFRVVGTIIIATLAAFFIFKKIKYYCVSDLNGPRIFIIIASIVLLAFFLIYSFRSIIATNEFYRSQESTRAESNKRILQIINKELPIDKKSTVKIDVPMLTYLYAQDIYRYENRIIEYQTSDGSKTIYTPTTEDRDAHDMLLFMRVYTISTTAMLIIYSCFASIAIISALVIGLSSRKAQSNAA